MEQSIAVILFIVKYYIIRMIATKKIGGGLYFNVVTTISYLTKSGIFNGYTNL